MKQMEGMNIKLGGKEVAKMEKLADKNRKISRYSNTTLNHFSKCCYLLGKILYPMGNKANV